jgi:AraC family transcriptional regulator, regulatory protein of adaptative response / DNA-3-methyladenine glycosylase II
MATAVRVDGPFDWDGMLTYFGPRAIRGVEHVGSGAYRRVAADGAVVEIRSTATGVRSTVGPAARVRRLLGLDRDHAAAFAALRRDPLIGPLIRARPGMRVPGTWDPFETGVRAIVGQQVSVAGASTVTARIVVRHGAPIIGDPVLTHRFPTAEVLATADLDGLGLTGARITAIRGFAAAVADGSIRLDGSASYAELAATVVAVRGLGPWTADYLAIRTGHADAFPVADLGLQRATGLDARSLAVAAERWRPHRALAAVLLWEGGV